MFNYLKDRFAEYALSIKEEAKKEKPKSKKDKEDPYVDFEIVYQGTDVIIDSFSMEKSEISKDFKYSLARNLSEVLEVDMGNIRVLAQDGDTILCEVSYSGKAHEYIKHEVKRISARPQEAHLVDEDIYNDLDDGGDNEIYNPYTDGSWSDKEWFCIRCGFMLMPIPPKHTTWGELAWEVMTDHKTQWYLCTNKDCFHFDGPLVLHHPHKGWMKPAGDAYSMSWVK